MGKTGCVILLAALLFIPTRAVFAEEGTGGEAPFGRRYTVEVGGGLPYAAVGVGGEWFPLSFLSIFGAILGADGVGGLAVGLRAYPVGHAKAVNPYIHGFVGGVAFMFSNDRTVGIPYSGGGAGFEFLFGEESLIRLGADYGCARFGCATLPHLAYGKRF